MPTPTAPPELHEQINEYLARWTHAGYGEARELLEKAAKALAGGGGSPTEPKSKRSA